MTYYIIETSDRKPIEYTVICTRSQSSEAEAMCYINPWRFYIYDRNLSDEWVAKHVDNNEFKLLKEAIRKFNGGEVK